MCQSIPSLTIPRAILGDSHILVAPEVRFLLLCLARGSVWGVLNQSKSSIILKKNTIFALSLKQMSSSSFHMFIYARSGWQQIHSVSEIIQVNWNSSWSKFHRIEVVSMANMPKKSKLCSRFLLLKIYPDFPCSHKCKYGAYSDFSSYALNLPR